jgi:hypothetical protein
MNIIDELEKAQMKQIPDFKSGDTVIVQVRIKEGEKTGEKSFEEKEAYQQDDLENIKTNGTPTNYSTDEYGFTMKHFGNTGGAMASLETATKK